jgi:cytochrome c556
MAEEVGALRIIFGADAGEFETTTDKVDSRLDRMAKRFGITAGVVQAATESIIDIVTEMVASVLSAVPQAIKTMDDLTESAMKIGTSAESLSSFAYAADLTEISVRSLTTAAGILSKNLANIAAGDTTSAAARSLTALGISAIDSEGKVKSFDAVMLEVADRFSGVADGAGKTAIALNLFGESGGKLIPLLNEGAGNIAKLRDEAERLGLTFSNETGKAASELQDQLFRMSAATRGVVQQFAIDMLPILKLVTDQFVATTYKSGALYYALEGLSIIVKGITSAFLILKTSVSAVANDMWALGQAVGSIASGDFSGAMRVFGDSTAATRAEIQETTKRINELWGAANGRQPADAAAGASGLQGFTPKSEELPQAPGLEDIKARAAAEAEALQKVNEVKAERNRLEAEGKRLIEDLRDPMEQLAAQELKIAELRRTGALTAVQGAALIQKSLATTASTYAGMAAQIAGNLQGLFGESKGFAIAQAIINTAEAVTKTLATYGATPWGLALAASAAAAGVAQVNAIRSTNKNGGGGGGGSFSGGAPATVETPKQQQGVFISLQGELFGREQVRGLIEQINGAVADGAVLRVS